MALHKFLTSFSAYILSLAEHARDNSVVVTRVNPALPITPLRSFRSAVRVDF